MFTLLQSSHSSGVPLHWPPNDCEKHDPEVAPDLTFNSFSYHVFFCQIHHLGGPMYSTEQPPPA